MLDQFKGCLLGAAIGDALGMARESTPPDFQRLHAQILQREAAP